MSKRLCLTAGFVLTLLAAPALSAHAQNVTMEWQNAPLSQVIRAFARFSGRTIVLASDVGDPEVTASLQNVDWQRALGLVLARLGLVERVDPTGVIRVERRTSPTRAP
jgi:type II secretory pathway component HofQ